MTPDTCVDIVTRFYAVTGRRLPEKPAESDAVFAAWEEAIGDLPDDTLALAAAVEVMRTADLRYGLPAPVVFREAYIEQVRRHPSPRRELVEETNPVVAAPEVNRAALRKAMDALFRIPADAPPAAAEPQRLIPSVRAGAHEFGDHELCGLDCPDRPTDPVAEPEPS